MKTSFFLLPVVLSLVVFGCNKQKSFSGLQPFSIDHANTGTGAVDISFLLEKPAGKDGFITVNDGKLVKPNGDRIRLWGVNITDWTKGSVQIPEKNEAELYAKTLARYGINCVRLTFLDFSTPRGIIDPNYNHTQNLDSTQLNKLDYWIWQLKENGIYTDLNLLVGRTFKEGDNVRDYDKIGWAKYVSYFDPQLIKLQKDFAQKLLTHYNPYTKSSYTNEPAIVIVELLNENTLFDAWHRNALHPGNKGSGDPNFRNLTEDHSEMLTRMFNDYLKTKFSTAEIQIIREQSQATEEEPIPRARKVNDKKTETDWLHATISFYVHVERQFFTNMRSYLQDTLKVQPLLVGSNDFLHNQSEYPMLYSNKELDVMDGHVYWQHPSWPGKINTPMVNEPDSSSIAKLSRTALANMPYTVTEVNNAFPSDYECEGIPLVAAYGAFQGWDGIMIYTFEPKIYDGYKGYIGDAFDISHHPVKMPQMIAGSLMYLRGDVNEANKTVLRSYSDEQIYQTMIMSVDEFPYYTPGYDVSNVFRHKVRIGSLNETYSIDELQKNGRPLISDTKELEWAINHNGDGCVTVNTPFSQAVVGFTNGSPKELENLQVKVENDFCAITLSSLDNKPIRSASQLLLTAGARAENMGLIWKSDRSGITERGGAPSLVEVVSGRISLSGLEKADQVIIKPLDGRGTPYGEYIVADMSGDSCIFSIGKTITTWYKIEIERE